MNKLPSKKKDTLKQLGVRFTGQMTLTDKSIVVENFIKFCEVSYASQNYKRGWVSQVFGVLAIQISLARVCVNI